MKKILLIEDEPEARTLLILRLSAHRFEVVGAGDGVEGSRKAKEFKPDLIVLDLKLPGDDGIQIYDALRKDPSTQKVPVLFLTAISPTGNMSKESLALIAASKHSIEMKGEYAVMGKPYDSRQLVETIRRLLGEL